MNDDLSVPGVIDERQALSPAPSRQSCPGTRPPSTREKERRRYLEVNSPAYGHEAAIERWNRYAELIVAKYGGHSIEAAWRARDRGH